MPGIKGPLGTNGIPSYAGKGNAARRIVNPGQVDVLWIGDSLSGSETISVSARYADCYVLASGKRLNGRLLLGGAMNGANNQAWESHSYGAFNNSGDQGGANLVTSIGNAYSITSTLEVVNNGATVANPGAAPALYATRVGSDFTSNCLFNSPATGTRFQISRDGVDWLLPGSNILLRTILAGNTNGANGTYHMSLRDGGAIVATGGTISTNVPGIGTNVSYLSSDLTFTNTSANDFVIQATSTVGTTTVNNTNFIVCANLLKNLSVTNGISLYNISRAGWEVSTSGQSFGNTNTISQAAWNGMLPVILTNTASAVIVVALTQNGSHSTADYVNFRAELATAMPTVPVLWIATHDSSIPGNLGPTLANTQNLYAALDPTIDDFINVHGSSMDDSMFITNGLMFYGGNIAATVVNTSTNRQVFTLNIGTASGIFHRGRICFTSGGNAGVVVPIENNVSAGGSNTITLQDYSNSLPVAFTNLFLPANPTAGDTAIVQYQDTIHPSFLGSLYFAEIAYQLTAGLAGAVDQASVLIGVNVAGTNYGTLSYLTISQTAIPATVTYTAVNTSTGLYVSGDAANHTLSVITDGTVRPATATPVSVGNGQYTLVLDGTQTNGTYITVEGTSTTASVAIIPKDIRISGASGTGAFPVTVTVTDGTNPISNATVRLNNTHFGQSNGSGIFSTSIDTGTYTLSITYAGYQYTPTSVIVSGASSFNAAMTPMVAVPSANPGICRGSGYVYDANGNALVGEIVEYRIEIGDGSPTTINNRRVHQATSIAGGLVTIDMEKGYTYGIRYDSGDFVNFLVPTNVATCSLAQVLGRMGG